IGPRARSPFRWIGGPGRLVGSSACRLAGKSAGRLVGVPVCQLASLPAGRQVGSRSAGRRAGRSARQLVGCADATPAGRMIASMPRLTRIYTRKGDDGTTGLGGGQRVPKDARRVSVYGTVDELNSHLGVVLAALPAARLVPAIERI